MYLILLNFKCILSRKAVLLSMNKALKKHQEDVLMILKKSII